MNINKTGRLHKLLLDIREATKLEDSKARNKALTSIYKISTQDAYTIPSFYGGLDPRVTSVDKLENDDIVVSTNGHEMTGLDMKSLHTMIYMYPRGTYIDFKTTQLKEPGLSGAVPLALLGFRRHFNLPYSKFFNSIPKDLRWDEQFKTVVASDESLEKIARIDAYLGKAFSSTTINEDGQIVFTSKLGLVALSVFKGKKYTPSYKDILIYRSEGKGNYKGHFSTVYGSKMITAKNDAQKVYNYANSACRLMIAQRWAWYGLHRNTDMICDFQDWDRIPNEVDKVNTTTKSPVMPKVELKDTTKGIFGV